MSARRAPGAPRPLTALERRRVIIALRDRLRPNVTDRTLLETYLTSTDWDAEAAYNLWQADRAKILSERGATEDSVSSAEASSEDEKGDESSSSSSSSSLSNPPRTAANVTVITAEDDEDEKDGKNEEEEEEETRTLNVMRRHLLGARLNHNVEQERRDAAVALRLHYESEMEETLGTTTLSPSEAILLLHVNSWDLGEAADSFTSLEDVRLQLRDYDRMRTRLPTAIDPDEVDTMREQDERLAEFINITGRPDWWSLRVVLQDHNWNLIEAVSFWFLRGVSPVRPSKKEVHRTTKEDPDGNIIEFGIRVGVDERSLKWPSAKQCDVPAAIFMDEGWGVEPDQYTPTDASETEENDEKTRKGKSKVIKKAGVRGIEGFLLGVNGDPYERVYKGCPNPAKFLVEHISKGRYTFKRFRQEKRFIWPDLKKEKSPMSPSARVEFDWNDPSHIQLLNNWRRQAVDRTIKGSRHNPGQAWSQEEDEYLIKLSEELFEEKSQSSTHSKRKTVVVSNKKKEEWRESFNKKFTGTIPQGSTEPRTDRTLAALMQRRSRIQEIVDRFHVKPDARYFLNTKRQAGKRRKRADSTGDADAHVDQSNMATSGEIIKGEEGPEDNGASGDDEEVPMDISSDDDEGSAPMDLSD
ncbi:hypothetical protein AYL99_00431 [Fonsecaea erecta]|uniref:Uncharacterized protein n=1 Tax=Fonsecaea erecta TaxID=1367422 RepID=A0A178ZXB6_9EURO|nr:hypothetical protein AYL99_00431 [Fonsecaea erecta]OAP64459.1 hypothetical protein AYL99_00431 [Fonsecaea erecta]